MRKLIFLLAAVAGLVLVGGAPEEAQAQCNHLGSSGACPVGVPNGSTSVTILANGNINWGNGLVSGPCCAAPAGTETGAGVHNLGNALGQPFHYGPVVDGVGTPDPSGGPTSFGFLPIAGTATEIVVTGLGFEDFGDCGPGGCAAGQGATLFGSGPNGGYLCDAGGGCGSDAWTPSVGAGFGQCGAGDCGGAAPLRPLDFSSVDIPNGSPYASNRTTGDIDPFGGGGSFVDPTTGEAIALSDDESQWPDKVKHAAALNGAYVNGQISYPFNDPGWADKSVDDFKTAPPAATGYADTLPTKIGGGGGDGFTSYVAIVTAPPRGPIAPGLAVVNTDPTVVQLANRRVSGGPPPVMETVQRDGAASFDVVDPATGRRASFRSADEAQTFASGVANGVPWDQALTAVQTQASTQAPVAPSASPNIGNSIAANVPNEFRRPFVSDRMDGEIRDIYVNNPQTGERVRFQTTQGAQSMVDALNGGKSWADARNAGSAIDRALQQAHRAAGQSTDDGGPRYSFYRFTPETAQPAQLNVIVAAPDSGATAGSGSGSSAATTPAPGRTPAPAPAPRSARPAGENVAFMEQAPFQGTIYRIEIIRTPDGKTLAVGTGDQAGHVFGEAKQGSFGWRREGPWAAPAAPTAAAAPAATVAADLVPRLNTRVTPTGEMAANLNIRVEIADSDREHMSGPAFTDGFETGDVSRWSATGR